MRDKPEEGAESAMARNDMLGMPNTSAPPSTAEATAKSPSSPAGTRAANPSPAGTAPARPSEAVPEPIGSPYPLYNAPRLSSFNELVTYMETQWGDGAAFEPADGEPLSYRELVREIRQEAAGLDASDAGRFVDVRDADPVRFAVRYLAVVSTGRCAVLCPLTDKQAARVAGNPASVPAGVGTIASSSGTSGVPKAAMLTERGLLADLACGLELYEFARGARYAKLLPYTHAFGLVCDLLAPLATGGTIALPHASATFAAELPRLAPTALNLPPRAAMLLASLLDKGLGENGAPETGRPHLLHGNAIGTETESPRFKPCVSHASNTPYRLPTLRKMLCGGAGLPASVTHRLRAHGIEAFGCYGLTECSPCVSVNRDNWYKDGSCGVPLRCNEARVTPSGELLVRGENVMVGYLGNAALTSERLHDGWLHTGDVGRIDADGFLHVDGRLDDVIVLSDGTKVAPEVIERALEAHPAIMQALVYGTDERLSRGDADGRTDIGTRTIGVARPLMRAENSVAAATSRDSRAGTAPCSPGQTVLACKIVLAEDASKSAEADAVEFARNMVVPGGTRIEHVTATHCPLPTNAAGKLLRRLP